MRSTIFCGLGLLITFTTACASIQPISVRVNAFAPAPQSVPPGARIAIIENLEAPNSLLEHEIAVKIAKRLSAEGFTPSTLANAEYHLVFGYNIGAS